MPNYVESRYRQNDIHTYDLCIWALDQEQEADNSRKADFQKIQYCLYSIRLVWLNAHKRI